VPQATEEMLDNLFNAFYLWSTRTDMAMDTIRTQIRHGQRHFTDICCTSIVRMPMSDTCRTLNTCRTSVVHMSMSDTCQTLVT